ncbi:hypothetical protein PD280_17295 [Virgibacillus salarius]|uniref:hypothetical protein n=1 Tax=Virgibacillus salarius TaxID=447199 RepID=UPI00041142AB|nr:MULTISPECIES: hypothetical protein [Bacillaceae]WBX79444.1 hypothetical protein PD280_17295 [Virgibacillus salarius]
MLKNHYSEERNIAVKNSKDAKDIMDSLIPLGMIFGCALGVIMGIVFEPYLLFTTISGTGIGYLIGVIAYVIYSMNEKS